MVKTKFTLMNAETFRQVKGWFDSGRGVSMWTNKDLSNMSRPEMITPGDATKAPHWAYVGTPEALTPEDIEVTIRTPVSLPREWFPECEFCKGSGARTVTEIAAIQKRDHADVREFLNREGGGTEWINEELFKCNACQGTGHNVTTPEFRVKRLPPYKGGGFEVSKSGISKCNKLAKRLDEHYQFQRASNIGEAISVKWDWQHWGNGMARAFFYTESTKPFTEYAG